MEMMKALVYEKPGRANGSIKLIPKPVCGDNEVLMKVMACSICKPAESSHDRESGSLLGEYPATPGHEFAGIVEAVGKNVKDIKVGDRITADNAYPCGSCHNCRQGRPMMCENYKCQGHNMQGGFAQYMVCASGNVHVFPDSLDYDSACLTELVNCAHSAVKNANVQYGETVLILGAGSSGNLVAQLFKNSNAGRVICIDSVASKLEKIAKAGVETILVDRDDYSKHEDVLKKNFSHGIDIIVDCAGDDGPLLESSMPLLAAGGRLVLYSFFYFEPKTFKVDPGLMIRKGLSIVSAPLQDHNFGNSVSFIANRKIDASLVISKTYPLDDYFKALDEVLNDNEILKVVIHPNGN